MTRDDLIQAIRARVDAAAETGDHTHLTDAEAVDEVRRLAEITPNVNDDLDVAFVAGWFHWLRFQLMPEGNQAEADLAFTLFEPVYHVDPEAVPEELHDDYQRLNEDGPHLWFEQANELLGQHQQTGDLTALRTAVELLDRTVTEMEWVDLDAAMAFDLFGIALEMLGSRTDDPEALARAAEAAQAAVAATPPGHPTLAARLDNLGNSLLELSQRTGDPETLARAVEAARGAVEASPYSLEGEAPYLHVLAKTVHVQAKATGDRALYDEAVEAMRQAIQATPAVGAAPAVPATPEEDRQRLGYRNDLAHCLLSLGERFRDEAAIAEAVQISRENVQMTSADQPDYIPCQFNLAGALRTWADQTGDLAVLREAVELTRLVGEATPPDHFFHLRALDNLAGNLLALYDRTGVPTTLPEAAQAVRRAMAETSGPQPARHIMLGRVLQRMGLQAGDADQLAEAVGSFRSALHETGADPQGRAGAMDYLAIALRRLGTMTGDLGTLEEAVHVAREATALAVGGRVDALNTLGLALRQLGAVTRDREVLSDAVEVAREALDATPLEGEDHARRLFNLAGNLLNLHQQTDDAATLDEAVQAARKVVEIRSGSSGLQRAEDLNLLAVALRQLFFETREPELLAEAVVAARDSVRDTPGDAPERPGHQFNLAAGLVLLGQERARRGDHEAAFAAYEEAIPILPESGPEVIDPLGLAVEAASAAFLAGRPERMARILERTRPVPTFQLLQRTVARVSVQEGVRLLDELAGALGEAHSMLCAEALVLKFELTKDPAALRSALDRILLRRTPAGVDDERVVRLATFGELLAYEYDQTELPPLVEAADEILRAALALVPDEDGSGRRAMIFANMANVHRQSAGRTDSRAAAERAVEAAREAVRTAPAGSETYDVSLFNLATALLLLAQHDPQDTHLDEGLQMNLRLLAAASPEFSHRSDVLANLKQALMVREHLPMPLTVNWADEVGDLPDDFTVDEVIEVEVRHMVAGLVIRLAIWSNDLGGLDRGIAALRAARGRLPDGHDFKLASNVNLGLALRNRFEFTGRLQDLEEAIEAGRSAVRDARQACADGAGVDVAGINLLGVGSARTDPAGDDRAGDDRAADDSVRAHMALATGNLVSALTVLGDRTGDPAPLAEAIDLVDEVLRDLPDLHPERPGLLNGLCVAYRYRYGLTGESTDLTHAIRNGELAALAAAEDLSDRAGLSVCLLNLGTALRDRYDVTGDLADLELAIERLRGSVEVTPTGDPGLAMRLSNLSHALMSRYGRHHARDDLNEAIDLVEAALRLTPPGSPEVARFAANLCGDLLVRYGLSNNETDLGRAREAGELAVETTPPGHPLLPLYLTNLSSVLRHIYHRSHDPEILDQALAYARRAVEQASDTNPRKPLYLGALSALHHDRHLLRSEAGTDLSKAITADLSEAVANGRKAMELAPADTPDWARYAYLQGRLLLFRADTASLHEAVGILARVATSSSVATSTRIDAAKAWGGVLDATKADPADVLKAYRLAIELLPTLAWHGVAREDRESLLAEEIGLPTHAAATALDADRPQEAVEVLELGRGVLWSQLLDFRSDFRALHESHPEQARKLDAVRAIIDADSSGLFTVAGGA